MSQTLVTLIQFRISMAFLLAFMLLFLRLRYRWGVSIAIACAVYLATWAMEVFLILPQPGWDTVDITLWTMLEALVVQATAFVLSRYRDFRALFTGITSAAYVLIGNVLFTDVYLYTGNLEASVAVQVVIHGGFLAFFIIRVRKEYLEEMDLRATGWGPLCIIPALFYAAEYSLYVLPGAQMQVVVLPSVLMLFIMAYAYSILFRLVSQQRRDSILQRNNEFLDTFSKNLAHETQSLQDSEAKTALIRHDMRHYSAMIRAYLDAGEPEKIRELLGRLDDRLDETQPKKYCENMTINGILSGFVRQANLKHIPCYCDVQIPEIAKGFDEFELATVIANLMENALSAAEEVPDPADRFVRLKARRIKEQALVEVSNSFVGERRFSDTTGLPLSDKGEGHGYGLRSVQAFASRNNGIFDYSTDDGVFNVRMSFGLPAASELSVDDTDINSL